MRQEVRGGERRLIVLVLAVVSLVTRWALRGSAGLVVLQSEVPPPPGGDGSRSQSQSQSHQHWSESVVLIGS